MNSVSYKSASCWQSLWRRSSVSGRMFWVLWQSVILQQLWLNKWSFSLNVKMNNTVPTRAPSVCIPFISDRHTLFLMFPHSQWKKAVASAKEKLREIWQLDVQKGGWGHPSHLLETSYVFQAAISSVSLGSSVWSLWFTHCHVSKGADTALFFFFFLLALTPGIELQPTCSFTSWKYTCRSNSTTLCLISETIHLIKFAG